VLVCVCVGFVIWGCFGNMFVCFYCAFLLFCLCIFILICFVFTGVRTAANTITTTTTTTTSSSSSSSSSNKTRRAIKPK
jgi:Na+/H+-dicarboxylate symporter